MQKSDENILSQNEDKSYLTASRQDTIADNSDVASYKLNNNLSIDNSENITIECAVEKILFRNEKNGYTVCLMQGLEDDFVAVGSLPFICEGEQLSVYGKFVMHNSYGEQFKVEKYTKSAHTSLSSIEKYLSDGFLKGIGPAMAKKITAKYGLDTLDVMMKHPEKISMIKGISRSKANEYAKILIDRGRFQDLFLFLAQYSINQNTCVKIEKVFREKSLEVIKDNPYELFQHEFGIKFQVVDRIAIDMGYDIKSSQRIQSVLYAVLKNYLAAGHTCLEVNLMYREASKLLGWQLENNEYNLNDLKNNDKIQYIPYDNLAAIKIVYDAEKEIAENIRNRIANGNCGLESASGFDKLKTKIINESLSFGFEFDEEQISAIFQCLINPVTVITGGPGTGKTTLLKFLSKYVSAAGKKIALAAPTGRAAKRMQEITKCEAKTIHRLLEFQYRSEMDEFELVFMRDEFNPIEADIIFIDEASMIDVFLMRSLLKAINYNCQIVLIGDVNQLPAVGAGNVLNDMILSETVGCIKLNKVYRQEQGGLIAVNSHTILNGEYPVFEQTIQSECMLIDKSGDLSKMDAVVGLNLNILESKYAIDPIRDVQILAPSKKDLCGTVNINLILQERFQARYGISSAGIEGVRNKFFVGDKVIQTRNNYEIQWIMQADRRQTGKAVLNGEVGFVVNCGPSDGVVSVLFDEERLVDYNQTDLEDLELAYAITVHKSQGSEYPVVILVLPDAPWILMTRNLLYTAFSRAKKRVFVITEKRILSSMIKNTTVSKRNTMLLKLLKTGDGNEKRNDIQICK